MLTSSLAASGLDRRLANKIPFGSIVLFVCRDTDLATIRSVMIT